MEIKKTINGQGGVILPDFSTPNPCPLIPSLADFVKAELLTGKHFTKYDIQKSYSDIYGVWVDPTSIGARIRDLRKLNLDVRVKRIRQGVFEYWIEPHYRQAELFEAHP